MPSNGYQRYSAEEQRKSRTIRWIIEGIVCVVLITAAFAASRYALKLIHSIMDAKIKLQPGSEGFETWLNPPIDTVRSYYLFNVTNSFDVVSNPQKTVLQVHDTPPYTYKVKTVKYNTTWLENNTRLDYEVERIITRDTERFNVASENDTGVFVDSTRASIRALFGKKANPAFYTLGGPYTFPTGKPVDILEGFSSLAFETARKSMIGPNTEKFGFVYRQNGSGLYSVSIETEGAMKGQVKSFASNLVQFNMSSSKYPFPVYDSLTYPPMLFDKPKLYIFHADFCRPVLLEFTNNVQDIDGVAAHEYRVKFIDIDPEADPSDINAYHEVQTLDVSQCISAKLPQHTFFLSKAHFYGSSDESIAQMKIEGFSPSRDKHDSVVFFEPNTGTPLKAVFRMQVNINTMVDPMRMNADDSGLEPTKGKGYNRTVPLFWIDQDIELSAWKLRSIRLAVSAMRHVKWIFPALGVLISVLFVVVMEFCARRCQKQSRRGYVKADTLVYH